MPDLFERLTTALAERYRIERRGIGAGTLGAFRGEGSAAR